MVLDGAHTPSSVSFTVETFLKVVGAKSAPHVLFACAADKDVEDIAPIFRDRFSRVTLTVPGSAKTSDLPRAENAFKSAGMDFESYPDYGLGIHHALESAQKKQTPLLVVGSFYLVSEVKKILIKESLRAGMKY